MTSLNAFAGRFFAAVSAVTLSFVLIGATVSTPATSPVATEIAA